MVHRISDAGSLGLGLQTAADAPETTLQRNLADAGSQSQLLSKRIVSLARPPIEFRTALLLAMESKAGSHSKALFSASNYSAPDSRKRWT